MPLRSKHLKAEHGFDKHNLKRHRAFHRLQELLCLDDLQFLQMKELFRKLTAIHFDTDKIGRCQSKALDETIEDLKSRLPRWFNKGDVERLEFFARRALLITHAARRNRLGSRKKENEKKSREDEDDSKSDTDDHPKEKKRPIPRPPTSVKQEPSLAERMAANLLSVMNGTQAPKIFASPARVLRNVQSSSAAAVTTRLPLSDISASASKSLARQHRSPILPSEVPNLNADARILSSSISEAGTSRAQVSPPSLARHDSLRIDGSRIKATKLSFSTPTAYSSNMVAGPSTSTSCGDTQGCSLDARQIRSVHKFLEAATPSMTYLLHRFIEFGCHGEDFLFAVSMWSPERIRTFLKSLPPGPGESELTRMEVEILSYHFESYFLASKSNLKA